MTAAKRDRTAKWGPSPLCQKGQHGWCMNRSPEESHCGCECHKRKEAMTADRTALRARIVAKLSEHAGMVTRCGCHHCILLRDVVALLDAETGTPQIDCPLCGVTVPQVASATLSLALWQHVNWVCAKRPADAETGTGRPYRHGYGCPNDGDDLVRPRPDDCVCDDHGETAISRQGDGSGTEPAQEKP